MFLLEKNLNNFHFNLFIFHLIDSCGWEDVSWSFYSWSHVKASDAIAMSPKAPGYDHTLNTPQGWYE